jgi:hypothetical protein
MDRTSSHIGAVHDYTVARVTTTGLGLGQASHAPVVVFISRNEAHAYVLVRGSRYEYVVARFGPQLFDAEIEAVFDAVLDWCFVNADTRKTVCFSMLMW